MIYGKSYAGVAQQMEGIDFIGDGTRIAPIVVTCGDNNLTMVYYNYESSGRAFFLTTSKIVVL
jgi:hypothetical protein